MIPIINMGAVSYTSIPEETPTQPARLLPFAKFEKDFKRRTSLILSIPEPEWVWERIIRLW